MVARLVSAGIGLLSLLLPAASLYGQTDDQPIDAVPARVWYEVRPSAQVAMEVDDQDWRPQIRILRRDFAERNSPSASFIPTRWDENVFQLIPTRWDARMMLVPNSQMAPPRLHMPRLIMPEARSR